MTVRLAASLLAALLLAACGGDQAAPPDERSEGAEPEATAPADEAAAPDDEPAPDTSGSALGCIDLLSQFSQAQAAYAATAFGADGEADLAAAADMWDALAEAAPAEIRDDFRVMAEALGPFLRVMAEIDLDFTSGEPPSQEQIAAMEQAAAALDEDALEAAATRVEAWFDANC